MTERTQNIKCYQKGEINTFIGMRIQSVKNSYFPFKQNPLIGYSTSSFYAAHDDVMLSSKKIKSTSNIWLFYNSYLNIGVELGIVDIILFLLNSLWKCSFLLSIKYRYLVQVFLISVTISCSGNWWLNHATSTLLIYLYMLF